MPQFEQEFETLKINIAIATQEYLRSLDQLTFTQFRQGKSYLKHLHVRNGMRDTEKDLSAFWDLVSRIR